MKLNEFLNGLHEVIPEYEIPEYDEGALIDALTSEKPELQLKEVFGESFYPKIKRWFDTKFKKTKIPEEATNYIGGIFKYKLDIHLQKEEVSDDEYQNNIETLSRELLQAIGKWGKKVIKDQELPPPIVA